MHADDDTEVMYTQLIGAAVFVVGFIVGSIMIIRPFRIESWNYLRDIFFYGTAIIYIHFAISDHVFDMKEVIATIGFYIAYLVVVVIEHISTKLKIKKLKAESAKSSRDSLDLMRKVEEMESIVNIQIRNRKDSSVIFDQNILKELNSSYLAENQSIFKTFLQSLNPIDSESWRMAGHFGRAWMIIQVSLKLEFSLNLAYLT